MPLFEKGKPRLPNAGRRAGTPNKLKKEIRDLLSPLVPESVKTLKEILTESTDEKVRLEVINTIFDRVYGKPTQQAKITGAVGVVNMDLTKLTDEQLEQLFRLTVAISGEGAVEESGLRLVEGTTSPEYATKGGGEDNGGDC